MINYQKIAFKIFKVIASNNARMLLTSVSDVLQKVVFLVSRINISFFHYLQSIVSTRECSGSAAITEYDLLSKNSVYYYLFIGRLSKSSVGAQALIESDIFVRYVYPLDSIINLAYLYMLHVIYFDYFLVSLKC